MERGRLGWGPEEDWDAAGAAGAAGAGGWGLILEIAAGLVGVGLKLLTRSKPREKARVIDVTPEREELE